MMKKVAALALLAVCAQCLPSKTQHALGNDADGDGLDDAFEMTCAQKFKPVVYLAQGEDFGPTTVDSYLSTCVLRKTGSCDSRGVADGMEVNKTGLCLWEDAVAYRYAGCWWKDPDNTLIGPEGAIKPSTLAATATAQCGGKDGCYIRCLHCNHDGKCENLGMDQDDAKGSHGAALASIPYYVHVFPDINGTVQVQYWFFYAFNGPTDGFGVHQGDWEHFSVRADAQCSTRLGYMPFAHGDPPPWSNATIAEKDGHPVVYSAINSHATYLTVGKHAGGTSITHDYTSKGDRWFPATLINAGETTNPTTGRRPMQGDTKWLDYTDVWGSDSGFDGSLDNGACDSGPHLNYNQMMPESTGSP